MTYLNSAAAHTLGRVRAAAVKTSVRKSDAMIIPHPRRLLQLTPRYSTNDLTAEEQRLFFRYLMESNEAL